LCVAKQTKGVDFVLRKKFFAHIIVGLKEQKTLTLKVYYSSFLNPLFLLHDIGYKKQS
jgi:hypothetical protein